MADVVFYYREIDTSTLSPGPRQCIACGKRIRLGGKMMVVSIGDPPPPPDRFSIICERCRGTQAEMTGKIWRRLFNEPAPRGTLIPEVT
jgi:hypothetical protein